MYIIPLIGVSNSGKTSAIKYAMIELLSLSESRIIYFSKYRRNDKGFNSDKREVIKFIKDDIDKGLKCDINICLREA